MWPPQIRSLNLSAWVRSPLNPAGNRLTKAPVGPPRYPPHASPAPPNPAAAAPAQALVGLPEGFGIDRSLGQCASYGYAPGEALWRRYYCAERAASPYPSWLKGPSTGSGARLGPPPTAPNHHGSSSRSTARYPLLNADGALLQQALRTLEARFAFAGLTEDLAASAQLFGRLHGLPAMPRPELPPPKHASEPHAPIGAADRLELTRRNHLDVQLYAAVRAAFSRAAARAGVGFGPNTLSAAKRTPLSPRYGGGVR